ncbi:MAG TPA: biopolymer transporter Tol [Ignavibacteriales bacterium]|nr:biopolymer transporter Tol [Ignavibacteriales bacterium]HOL80210.1 biopolymer transporter Tol [Ignavibacteriales bacterium]HOM64491.1 biopolymer transporter Tol [Ignavibacteriales bacterium]HPD66588.1 biopolymer transporter Tol [Ignavibacteriales bacterium]HPP32399.1 biopolymer transporter Tol [Ignavibacteriales bacterium]
MKKIYIFLISFGFLFSQEFSFHPELEWFTIKGKHCYVHYHKGAEYTAKTIVKIHDEVWDPITSLYDYEPEPTQYIVKDYDEYANGATYFFDNKIEIWATALDFDLRGTHNWLRNVITHEFTHMVQVQSTLKFSRRMPVVYFQFMNYGKKKRPDILYEFPNGVVSYPISSINLPNWLAEGTAQYQRKELEYDYWDSHRDMILRCYALDGKMLTFSQMGSFGKNSLGNESVYNSGFAFTRYISQKYGEIKLKEITTNLSRFSTFTIDKAINDAVGKLGEEVYNEWKEFITNDYKRRIEPVLQNRIEGQIIFDEGFGNLYPIFSKDGKKVYFISNRGKDYFKGDLYCYDLENKNYSIVVKNIRSVLSIANDDNILIYSKLDDNNSDFLNINDIYSFDIKAKKETRLTKGLRGYYPNLSPDNQKIVYVTQKDGTTNIGMIDIDGKNSQILTNFKYGEQVYNPKFSKDGKYIFFDYSYKDERDIYVLNLETKEVKPLIKTNDDERNPYPIDNENIIYVSDKTGIFNIYKYNFKTNQITQLSNVVGGAFYPSIDSTGNIVYAGFTSTGYKIFYLANDEQQKVDSSKQYVKISNPPLQEDKPKGDLAKFDIEKLRNFDDYSIPNYKSMPMKGLYSTYSFFPFLRIDNYSISNDFGERIKLGVYFITSDVLERYQFFAGIATNYKFDRDIFLNFEIKNRLPIFWSLGLKPILSFEFYNISRTANVDVYLSKNDDGSYDYQTKAKINFDLWETDIKIKHYIFNPANLLEFKFAISKYFSNIHTFTNPIDGEPILGMREAYYVGNNYQLKYSFNIENYYLDGDISPEETKFLLKYDYESSKLNPQYEVSDNNELKYVYRNYKFNRLETELNFSKRVYGSHTTGINLRMGTILNQTVPDFYDFYLGGLIGLKSYPFYSISGNHIAAMNLFYRFPIFKNIDKSLATLYLDKIFGGIYFDYGYAWNGKTTTKTFDKFVKGVGGELRFKLHSYYMFPTALFFNAAYGLDKYEKYIETTKTTVSYGKELQFYFGILFDFAF